MSAETTPLIASGSEVRQRRPGVQGELAELGHNAKEGVSSFFADWVEFIKKGNVVDLAVGIIMGGAFGGVVSSFVDDLVSPVLGLFIGHSLDNAYFILNRKKVCFEPGSDEDICSKWKTLAEAKAAGAITWNYGRFIQIVINFLVVSMVIFFFVKGYQRLKEGTKKKDVESKE
ncbi:hypothetical protein HK098_007936 [Nowakowskiella sp. JEL0407]|nr:hypothetical protein HK098_007936 [Nowakowskiella sp. JEL0407]